jgi:hypothetical protein
MIARTIATFLCVCMLVMPALAQDETEEPFSEGYVFKWAAEVIFPEGIRFTASLLRSLNELKTVTLIIQPEGRPGVSETVSFEEPVNHGDGFTDLAYVWDIPLDNPPQLFEDITYEWEVEDVYGEIARSRDKLTFTDPRVEWTQSDDPFGDINLTVRADGPSPQQIRQSVTLPYNLISANAGRDQAFYIMLYTADVPSSGCRIGVERTQVAVGLESGVAVPCDPEKAAAIIQASGFDLAQVPPSNLTSSTAAAIVEVFTQGFYDPLWQGKDVPDWFKTGLAQFYSPLNKSALLGPVRNMARADTLYPMSEMAQAIEGNDSWRAQSYAMVVYIADLIGVPSLFDMAKIANAESFVKGYEAATSQPLSALLPNLRRWIFTEAGAKAFDYTPYQAATATPTPTSTYTLTPTPPPTLTETPTLTPSVTGVLSATPSATRTPTRTPTPRPASVTPRPAGSLFTPTPVLTPSALEDPVTQQGILSVLLIALAVVGLIYWIMRRREL